MPGLARGALPLSPTRHPLRAILVSGPGGGSSTTRGPTCTDPSPGRRGSGRTLWVMSMAEEAASGTVRRGAHTIRWVMVGLAVAVLLPALAVLGSRLGKDATVVPSVLIGKPAPGFALRTLDGKTVSNADLRGKPYVVNFWASWCGPCREEHGSLRSFWERYGPEGVQLLGVIFQDSVSAARAFQQELGGDWPLLEDPGGRIAVDFGVRAPPETFVVDGDGKIVVKFSGRLGPGQLDEVVSAGAHLAG